MACAGAGLVTALCVASSFMCLYMCYVVVAGGSRPQPKAGKVSPSVSGSSPDTVATQDADGWGSHASSRDEGAPRGSHHKGHAQHQPQPQPVPHHSQAQPGSTDLRPEPAMATMTMAEGDQAAMQQVGDWCAERAASATGCCHVALRAIMHSLDVKHSLVRSEKQCRQSRSEPLWPPRVAGHQCCSCPGPGESAAGCSGECADRPKDKPEAGTTGEAGVCVPVQ